MERNLFESSGTSLLLLLVVWLIPAVAWAESAGDGASHPAESPLATHRTTVSPRELESWIAHGFPGREGAIDRDEALDQLILVRSLATEALRLDLDRKPVAVVELAAVDGRLAMQALRRHVAGSVSVSEDGVERKYQAIKDTYTLPRRVRLRNLFKRFPRGASEAEQAALRVEMQTLRQRVLDGAEFAALAEAESESQTRLRGGLLGNVRAGILRPEIDRIAMALQAGEVSDVLEGPEGLTLLFCETVLEAVHRDAAELREIAGKLLRRAEERRLWTEMEEHLLQVADAEWRWEILRPEGGEIDGAAVLVEYLGGRLTVAEAHALVAPRAALPRLAEWEQDSIRRRIEPFLRQRMAARETVVLGLSDEERAERASWSKLRVLAAKTLAELVSRRLEPVEDADAQAFFEASPDRFVRPAHYHLGLITLPFEAADPRPAHRLGLDLLMALEGGETTFEAIAREHSNHPSATKGGDLGLLPRPAVARRLGIDGLRALERLEPGERSDWVQDDERSLFLLLELRAFEPSRPSTFEEAREQARQLVGQQRAERLQEEVTAEWWQKLEVRRSDQPAAAELDE